MALARSASGPGGLSINTGSANLFGSNTSQPPAAGGRFGSATSQSAQSGSLFGMATSQPQATGSLFGNTTTTAQPVQGGGLFGSSTAQTLTQPQATGGLFGQTAASQPKQNSGLFGSATTQPAQSTGGGLFGNTATTQPQQTGGLFGATTTTQPAQRGGLFGSTTAQQPAQGGGLFGASTQQQSQTSGGLFGNTAANTNTGGMFSQTTRPVVMGGGLFGNSTANTGTGGGLFSQTAKPAATGGLFSQPAQQAGGFLGQSTAQQNQSVPGVRIDVSNIQATTRFNDLQEDLQKQIAVIDEGIQKCIKDKEAIDAFLPAHGEQVAAIPTDVSFVSRKSDGTQAALSGDIVAINQLREMIKTDADNARLSFRAVDNLKLPMQYHQAGLWSTRGQSTAAGTSTNADSESNSDLISFFSKTADEMDEMMKKFESNLGEIEVHLRGVQGNMLEQLQRVSAQSKQGVQGGVDERVLELAAVLRDFEEGILKVAGVVGGIKEGVTELQLKDFMGHGS